MKPRSKLVALVGLLMLISLEASAAVPPGDKRTILTSGEKVYPIHYQLGQSTVLFFGLRPETVICGNKNYFNIEKIKEGITIQPLSNFSTNLTVLAQGRRYLFFLTPAVGRPDGFVEVKWVPPSQARSIKTLAKSDSEVVRELGQKTKIGNPHIRVQPSAFVSFLVSDFCATYFEKDLGILVAEFFDSKGYYEAQLQQAKAQSDFESVMSATLREIKRIKAGARRKRTARRKSKPLPPKAE